jgi:hypothetical protein
MPQNVADDQKLLNFIADNPSSDMTTQAIQALGVSQDDIKLWKFARDNPNHELATKARNSVYDSIAASAPPVQEQGVSALDRFGLKNLVGENKELQVEYLKRKGLQARVQNDQVLVKKPGEARFRVVDPEGFDLFDVTDVAAEVVDAIATGFGFAGGAALGAPTGPGAVAAGAAGAGLAGAGVEAGRQFLGEQLGFRPEVDPSQIATSGLISAAVPAGLSAAGAGLRAAGRAAKGGAQRVARGLLPDDFAPKIRPEAKAIKEAGEELGIPTTSGQLVQPGQANITGALESALEQSQGKVGAKRFIGVKQAQKEAIEEVTEGIVEGAAKASDFEIGEAVKATAKKEIATKLRPAEALYESVEAKLGEVAPILTGVDDALKKVAEANKFNRPGLAVIKGLQDDLGKIQNLSDLKTFRSNVGDLFQQQKVQKVGDIYEALTKARSDSLLEAARTTGKEAFKTASTDIKKADKLFREAVGDVETLLKKKKPKGVTVKQFAEEALEKVPSAKTTQALFRKFDVKNLRQLETKFPEAFQQLKAGAIKGLRERASVKEGLSPRSLVRELDKLPAETKQILFGPKNAEVVEKFKLVLNSIPPRKGPSGTPELQELNKIFNIMSQARSIGQERLLRALDKQVATQMGKQAPGKIVPKTKNESIKARFLKRAVGAGVSAEAVKTRNRRK